MICWKLDITQMMIKESIRNKDDLSAGDFLWYFKKNIDELVQMLPENTEEQIEEIRKLSIEQLSESRLFSAEILDAMQKK